MGWLYGWHDRKSLIRHLTNPKPEWGKCLAHCLVGNDLWMVMEHAEGTWTGDDKKFICLCMLRGNRNHRDGWGYKDETESMGPIKDSCPLKYLAMVPDPPNEYGRQWREGVQEYHRRRKQKPKEGEVWTLVNCTIPWVVIEYARQGKLRGYYQGQTYRVKRRHLGGPLGPRMDWYGLGVVARAAAKHMGVETNEFEALLCPAVEAEQDRAPWLILADWLMERGSDDLHKALSKYTSKEAIAV